MKRSTLTGILVAVVLLLVVTIGYFGLKRMGSSFIPGANKGIIKDSGENISDYSAVFLTNGQVYFGKLYGSAEKVDLRDIYYLQVNQQIQPDQKDKNASAAQPNVVLVKLGEELHGPNDRMLINSAQVIFTESLKKDSKVIKAIDDYKAGKK